MIGFTGDLSSCRGKEKSTGYAYIYKFLFIFVYSKTQINKII